MPKSPSKRNEIEFNLSEKRSVEIKKLFRGQSNGSN